MKVICRRDCDSTVTVLEMSSPFSENRKASTLSISVVRLPCMRSMECCSVRHQSLPSPISS